MIAIDSMMVCLDLSDIDEKLVAYVRSICERLPVKKVFFVHNIKTNEKCKLSSHAKYLSIKKAIYQNSN